MYRIGCCGKKRAEFTSRPVARYKGGTVLRIRGNGTGKLYVFMGHRDIKPIDRRDVASLMAYSDIEIIW